MFRKIYLATHNWWHQFVHHYIGKSEFYRLDCPWLTHEHKGLPSDSDDRYLLHLHMLQVPVSGKVLYLVDHRTSSFLRTIMPSKHLITDDLASIRPKQALSNCILQRIAQMSPWEIGSCHFTFQMPVGTMDHLAYDIIYKPLELAQNRRPWLALLIVSPSVAVATDRLLYVNERNLSVSFFNFAIESWQSVSVPRLTHSETEILRYVKGGMKYQEIARITHYSQRTITTNASNIMKKLGVHNIGEAVKVSERLHLLDQL